MFVVSFLWSLISQPFRVEWGPQHPKPTLAFSSESGALYPQGTQEIPDLAFLFSTW